jgi:hypothetical protein
MKESQCRGLAEQHRATAEQWASVGWMRDSTFSSCLLELLHRIEALEAAAQLNHPVIPDSSLLKRVAAVIDNGTACDREHARIARDAIREVAAWMTSNPDHHFSPALVFALEQEAVKYHCATMIT